MSNHDHSHFFRNRDNEDAERTSFETYLESLNSNQRDALTDFYQTYCNPELGQDIIHTDGLPFNRDAVAYGRTKHNVFFALNVTGTAQTSPTEFSLQTLQKKGDEMLREEYDIVDVQHALRPNDPGIDRIVYASGSKKIALEMGRRAYWIEQMIVEDQEIELPFPVELFFRLPPAKPTQ